MVRLPLILKNRVVIVRNSLAVGLVVGFRVRMRLIRCSCYLHKQHYPNFHYDRIQQESAKHKVL